jgi:apolipoprotein N-acyltransferase
MQPLYCHGVSHGISDAHVPTVMTPQASGAETGYPINATREGERPREPHPLPAAASLSIAGVFGWSAGASVAFHVAYELCPPFIIVFLFCMFRVAQARARQHAMYAGWLIGLAIYGPQLEFFWTIFRHGAIGLWLLVGTWLGIYLVLQRFALLKLGPALGALAAPFLWTGLEYFRSELYYLRFSWLNAGFCFSPFPRGALIPWFGVYGLGFVLMLLAAQCPFLRPSTSRQRLAWTIALASLIACGFLLGTAKKTHGKASVPASALKVAGVQLEFPDERIVARELDKILIQSPEAQLIVLPEYTFFGPVPESIKNWCARHRKYLVAGGKQYLDRSQEQFRNTAFVIGPDGKEIFSQVKAVPIQFFSDGLPAVEQKVWDSPWGKLGFVVCYDLSYTRVTDELIRQGAQAIIAPTMDVEDWGERQHRLHGRVAPIRAAEYGIPIFRLCSSGISQVVDRDGTVTASAPFKGEGQTIEATLHLPANGKRPLDRFIVWPCVAVTAIILAWSLWIALGSAARRFFTNKTART